MPGTHHKQLSPVKRPPWLEKLSPVLRRRIDAEIDARVESAAAIYRRWNLLRFISVQWFRVYVRRRREALYKYNRRIAPARQAARKAVSHE